MGQRLHLFQEHKRSAFRDVFFEILQFVHARVLCAEHGAAVIHHHGEPEFVVRLWNGEHLNFLLLVLERDVPPQFEIDPRRLLFRVACAFKGIDKSLSTAVHDRDFGAGQLNQRIVYLTTVQCC